MKKKSALVIVAVLALVLLLSGCGGSSFPYQGTFNGNWTGQLTLVTRSMPVGGTISLKVDENGAGSGTVATTGGTVSPATMTAKVDSDGNLTGTVTFTINGTSFDSNWTGKITGSGNSLSLQGNWDSKRGSGTFSGANGSGNSSGSNGGAGGAAPK